MARHTASISQAGCCPTCGRTQFLTRGDARRHRRVVLAGKKNLDVKSCGGYFHVAPRPEQVSA